VNGSESAEEAAREYRRFFDQVAENQVVAAAEDILTDGWISELELLRTSLKRAADRARGSERVARGRAEDAEQLGDPAEIVRGRRQLAQALTARRLEYREIGRLLREVDAALETACEVGIERAQHGRDDLARLRSIRHKAFGRSAG
jgi:hypothetical protein